MTATNGNVGAAGSRPADPRITRVAIASTAVVLALLTAFLVWLALADLSRPGSELKVVGAAFGLIGVVITQAIALLGLLLKRSVDDRTLSISRAAEARLTMESSWNAALQREDRRVNRVRTVREFFEFLSSPDPRQKASALVLIGELGDPGLAIRLSMIYLTEGGLGAIATLTQSADEDLAQQATAAWTSATELLRRSVVRISVVDARGQRAPLTGFCVQTPTTVVTIGSETAGVEFPGPVEISRFDLRTAPATVVSSSPTATRLRLQSDLDLVPIEVGSSSRLQTGDFVYLLSFLEGAETANRSRGRVAERLADGDLSVAGFVVSDGSAGAPVVDGTGALVGMQCRSESAAVSQMRPVEAVVGMLDAEHLAG